MRLPWVLHALALARLPVFASKDEGVSFPGALRGPQPNRAHTASLLRGRRTTAVVPPVSQLEWTDNNGQAGQIGGGVIRWTPPADTTGIDGFRVCIASDISGAHQAQLWWADQHSETFSSEFPVGTNQFTLFSPTARKTTDPAYPANWLLVYSVSSGVPQAASTAAHVPLFDLAQTVPDPLDLSIETGSTYLSGSSTVEGSVLWATQTKADLGYVEEYAVYVTTSPANSAAEVGVAVVAVGTNHVVLPGTTTCAQGDHVVIYARNRHGRAAVPSWQALAACPVATLPATSTLTTTTSRTTMHAPGSVVFSDTNPEGHEIGGAVLQWNLEVDPGTTHFEVFLASDELGSHKAQLWHMDPATEEVSTQVAVGTNEFTLFSPTTRQTTDPAFPANWVLVFARSGGGVHLAGSSLLHDISTSVPPFLPMDSITVTDSDPLDYRISGTLQWTPSPMTDLALASHFAIFTARDPAGAGEVEVSTVPVGTNEFTSSWECWDRNHLLVYAANANGRASAASYTTLGGCSTAMSGEPTSPSSTSTTFSTSSSRNPVTVSEVLFTDSNLQAGEIGGATITWTPPLDASQVSNYEVYISCDQMGTIQGAQLWYQDAGGISPRFPVGTNALQIYEATTRSTGTPDCPATWVVVYSVVGTRREHSQAATCPLYDASNSVPLDVNLTTTFTQDGNVHGAVAGLLQWNGDSHADTAFATDYVLYLASDPTGTAASFVQSVPVGMNEAYLVLGADCWSRDHILVYLNNSHGLSSHASSQLLEPCVSPQLTTTSVATSTSTSTAATTTLVASESTTGITNLTFTDLNAAANEVGGSLLQWTPPSQASAVAAYQVYLANDQLGSARVLLWHADLSTRFPVGTNRFQIYEPTRRATAEASRPANWVLVFPVSDSGQLGSAEEAAQVPIYDVSPQGPGSPSLQVDSSGTHLVAGKLAGSVSWAATSSQVDMGFTEQLTLYLGADDHGIGEVWVANVSGLAAGTFALPSGHTCANHEYLALYAENPNGKVLATMPRHLLEACRPTTATHTATTSTFTTILATTTTATGGTTPPAWQISHMTFLDMSPELNQIGGAKLSWTPPPEIAGLTHYEAYLAHTQEGLHQAQLWWENSATHEIGRAIPVGTNQITLHHDTQRRTKASGYPANWLIMYTSSANVRQDVDKAVKVPIYDDSSSLPYPVFFEWIAFTDTDMADEKIAGVLSWRTVSLSDLGLVSEFVVYTASSTIGFDKVPLLRVPVGTDEVTVPDGTHCWNRKFLLIRASNPNGEAFFGASHTLSGCNTPPVTTVTFTTTTTVTTFLGPTSTSTVTTTREPWLMSDLLFADSNTEAGEIGGALIQWAPPADASTVASIDVYMAYDEAGSFQFRIWYLDSQTGQAENSFPVGTNRFHIFSPTTRRTHNTAYPANWVLVYARQTPGQVIPIRKTAWAPLYDHSKEVPRGLPLSLHFQDEDEADAKIAGTLSWSWSGAVDFGFTTAYRVYLASDESGTGARPLASVPVGTNHLHIPQGTTCWSNNHLLVFPSNPNGVAATASSHMLLGCTTPQEA